MDFSGSKVNGTTNNRESLNTGKKAKTGKPTAHTLARYRCFLPDLAGLAGLRCVGPGLPIITCKNGSRQSKSYPIQDEPGEEVGFQYKMSLEKMAC
jgi:hypothetical protein